MATTYGVIERNGINFSHDTAISISYINSNSGLTATDVQSALDELKTLIIDKINDLDVAGASNISAGKTIKSWSETNGKVSIATQDISITKSQISDFPTIPTVNNGVLTIQKNGADIATFSANSNTNTTANITIPAIYNGTLTITKNSTTTVSTFSANSSTDVTADITVPTLLSELSADSTHRLVTDTEKSTWNEKQDVLTPGANIQINGTTVSATDTTYAVATTAAAGLAPKLAGGTSKYLRADGAWDVPYTTVTTASNGLLPKLIDDATKYFRSDGEWAVPNDTTYTTATTASAGLMPALGTSTTKYLRNDGTWNVPNNTTYANATTISAGLMSASDKSKLNGYPSTGSDTAKFLRNDGSWVVPNDTTYAVVSTAANGLAPKVTNTSNFLKGDGTWAVPNDTTYAVMSSGTTGLVPSGGTNTKYLRGDATWQTTAAFNTTYGTATTASAGLMPALGNDTSKYLRNDGTWNEPDGKSWMGTSAAYSTLTIDPNMNYFLVG